MFLFKKISLLLVCPFFVLFCLAQQKDNMYIRDWQRIDSLIEKEGLMKSALQQVNRIYADARKTGNSPQLIKSLLYKMRISEEVSEGGIPENIRTLEAEIATSSGAAKAILNSIAA